MRQRPDNEKTILGWALEYDKLDWCIIPIKPRSKEPALRSWKPFQTKRPEEKQLRKWFSNNDRNMAVVLGPVSGDLVCRDFDTVAEYESWAKAYSDLAEKLPTVRTANGYHVYFVARIDGIKHIANGELRGRGGYCLLPSSIHPNGQVYEWVNLPLNGNLLALNPKLAGFMSDVTEHTEQTEQSEAIVDDGDIEKAINENLPVKYGTRNQKIFEFARTLQADQRLTNAGANQLKSIFTAWYEKALPNIRTKDFEENWFEFLYAWEQVIFAKGIGMVQILERAKATPVPQVAEKHRNPKMQLLICWCRELQSEAGNKPFWLSVRTVAKYLEIAPMTAWRYLFILVREEVLEEVEKGKMTQAGGVATRYQYIGN